MRLVPHTNGRRSVAGQGNLLKRFKRNRSGVVAIEFAMVAMPFLLFVFGIIGSGLYFFTDNGLQNAVETAARKVRTGSAQRNGMTVEQFRNEICSSGTFLDCSKLRVLLQKGSDWSSISPQGCVSSTGTLVNSSGNANDPVENYAGGAGEVVLITACYEWELAQSFSFLGFSPMGNGSALIQAAATFRTEPYQ